MAKKKPYHANNWKQINSAPAEAFPELSFEEFMDWKVYGFAISSSHCCVIRAVTSTGKVKEYSYRKTKAAERKINKLLRDVNFVEFTIVDDEQVQLIQRGKKDG